MVKSLAQKLALIGLNPVSINADNISKSVNAYSPINGFVSKVDVNIGKYVSPTDVLFELINPDDIHLALSVFSHYWISASRWLPARLIIMAGNTPPRSF